MFYHARIALTSFAIFLTSIASQAQDTSQKADDDKPVILEEVIVTAEKREERLQKVALSLDAIDGETLEREGIENTMELQMKTPTLAFNVNGISQQPYLRGVGGDNLGIGTETSVGVYLDGVNMTRTTAIFRALHDIDRVEVLKGPQGTLYGRNATGGAINVITRKPQAGFSASGDLTFGNLGKARAGLAVNAPLVADKVLTRFSVVKSEDDGHVKNVLLDQNLEAVDWLSGRAQLFWLINDRTDLLVTAEMGKEEGSRNLSAVLDTRAFAPSIDIFGAEVPENPREVRYDHDTYLNVDFQHIRSRLSYSGNNFTLNWLSSVRTNELESAYDGEGSEIPFVTSINTENSTAISQELLLSGNKNDRLDWMIGSYYLDEDADASFKVGIAETTPTGALFEPIATNRIRAWALFGQLDYALHNNLKLTVGTRFSNEQKRYKIDHRFYDQSTGISEGTPEWSAWTPKVALAYNPNEQVMWYFSTTRGFKSGGINSMAVASPAEEFNPEFLWSYEGGVKSRLANQRLQFNAAGFYYDFTDLQLNQISATNITRITNAAKAEIKGLEFSLEGRPVQNLRASLKVVFLDASFKEFNTANSNGDPGQVLDLAGNRMPRAPETSFNTSLNYTTPIGTGSLEMHGSYRYQSKVYYTAFETELDDQDGYGVANARITYDGSGRRWSISAYGTNLGDELYKNNVIHVTNLIGTLQFFGPPREYGLTFSFRR